MSLNSEMSANPTLYEQIYALVRSIPPGFVMTYGQVGEAVGCPARVVGYALHALGRQSIMDVPWHRVINRLGRISTSGVDQQALLEAEGVVFHKGVVDLAEFRYQDELNS